MAKVTDKEIAAARDAAAQKRAAGLAATSVSYDRGSRRLMLELTNGVLLGIPISRFPHIAGASDEELSTVELLGQSGIHIESLDADYSVAALVSSSIGQDVAARALGLAGGRARSDAKAAAARENGAKGGRPRRNIPVDRGVPLRTERDTGLHGAGYLRMRSASSGRFTEAKGSGKFTNIKSAANVAGVKVTGKAGAKRKGGSSGKTR